ncbi:MAG: S1 RNA-binding domain-containing protein [Deltaproteobacteria bacterium]|nr:S1 RNA-binding domain-containing protein [Deltaproteobacteria bacterium]
MPSFPKTPAGGPADDDDFAALLAEAGTARRTRYKPGDQVRGQVMLIGEKTATLQLPDGQEGLLDLSGMRGKDGKLALAKDDFVTGYVLRIRDRVIEIARQIGKSQISTQVLQDAAQSQIPVDGTVTASNKGGYVVDLGNGAQGFCPHAMIDVRRVEDAASLVGQRFQFRVLEVRGDKDVLLSRRAALEEEQARKAEDTRSRLAVGAKMSGTITNVREFGAFVDLGGVEGMIPASELAYGRVKVEDVVKPGEKVDVQVQRIEPGLDHKGRPVERISLSMRALAADPFAVLGDEIEPGHILIGRVRRVEPFGAFVELVPGVEGLVHISAFGRRISVPGEVVQPEMKVHVRVLAVDKAMRRLSLAYVDADKLAVVLDPAAAVPQSKTAAQFVGVAKVEAGDRLDKAAAAGLANAPTNQRQEKPRVPSIGELLDVTVDKTESFGVLVRFGQPGAMGRGMVPISELGLAQGADIRRHLPVGTTFAAVVIDSRPDGRVRLSRTGAERARERAEADSFLAAQAQQAARGGVGTFGELLLQRLGQPGANPAKK